MTFASAEAGSDEVMKYIHCMLAASVCCLHWLPQWKKGLNKKGAFERKQWSWRNVI